LLAPLVLLTPFLAHAQDARPAELEKDVLGGAAAVPAAAGAMAAEPIIATPQAAEAAPIAAAATTSAADTESTEASSTLFNGVEVPPFKKFTARTFEEGTKQGYWLIEYYSPYCPHCKKFAPLWQTLYEFYYTSKPVTGTTKEMDTTQSLNSFERYYDYHFGQVNCVTEGDMCEKHGVGAYPTILLMKGNKEVKRHEGKRTMEDVSRFIEENLEMIKPGSRPKVASVILPEPGATVAPSQAPEAALVLESAAATATGSGKKASKTAVVSKPSITPNMAGQNVELNPEDFQKLVTMSQEPWFIKFYAPWCHHCQALAPNWNQMARELQGKLNVGSVNCDIHRRLCQDVHVKAYPTIHFFRGGERVEYDGLRGLGDLVTYAKKAVDIGTGVAYVTAEEFKKMEETEEVIFIYFYDQATTSEDFAALDRLTLSLVGHAKLVKTDSASLAERFKIHTWPKLVVSRDGRANYLNALAPKDMRDFRNVLNWMQRVWLPLVPELTASNAHDVMDNHLVVLGVLDRDRPDEFDLSRKEMKNAAKEWMDRETHAFQLERAELRDSKQLRIEEADDRGDKRALRDAKNIRIQISEEDRRQVRFAWVDGTFWERWIRTTYGVQIKDGERVVIIDEENRRYWDQTISGEHIRPSRTSIMETLQKITSDPPKISPKYTINSVSMVFLELRRAAWKHPWLASIATIGLMIFLATWGRGRIRRSRGGTGGFHILGEKDGLLGGSGTNGKSD